MKILLTGAFGNLGMSTLPALLAQGHQVRCFETRRTSQKRLARHFADRIELIQGDLRHPTDLAKAVQDQEAIIHLACMLPPHSEEQPDLAYAINVDGTRNLLAAASSLARPPKFLFASSQGVFGHTQHLPPPRRTTDPVQPVNHYCAHKIAGEDMVKASGLPWTILRFSVIMAMGQGKPSPLMYSIPLEERFEVVHTLDAGLAVANAMRTEEVWGKILLIGGGSTCQIRYRDYLKPMLEMIGLGMLPERAFASEPYTTDWLDTEESQHLLNYQQYSFADIVQQLTRAVGYRRHLAALLRPAARWWLLRQSPFYRA